MACALLVDTWRLVPCRILLEIWEITQHVMYVVSMLLQRGGLAEAHELLRVHL